MTLCEPLKILFLTIFLLNITYVALTPVVFNDIEPYNLCPREQCFCDEESKPLCASMSRLKKDLKTYKNPCYFLCDARCLETQIAFFHCGKCDNNRNFTKFGQKGNPEDFTCLEFILKGQGSSGNAGSVPEKPSPGGPEKPPVEEMPGPTQDKPPVEEMPGPTQDKPPVEEMPGPTKDKPPVEEMPGPTQDEPAVDAPAKETTPNP